MHETSPAPITRLLKSLDRLIEETAAATLERHRLTHPQWHLLSVLAEASGTLAKLDEALGAHLAPGERREAAAEVEPLLGGGLVAEKGGVYRLTDAGRAEYRATKEALDGMWDRMVQGLNDDDCALTFQTLEAMIDNLSG